MASCCGSRPGHSAFSCCWQPHARSAQVSTQAPKFQPPAPMQRNLSDKEWTPSALDVSAGYASATTPELKAPDTPPLQTLRRRKIELEITEKPNLGPAWVYPGVGSTDHMVAPEDEITKIRERLDVKHHELGEWLSTSICGNDILSSVLYSSALVALKAGKLAPIPLLLVSLVLYFFRFIYEEVVTAIPLNGGSYNVLLNTTSKRVAAITAALSILSYLATGVVSATSAVSYLRTEVDVPLIGTTIGLLGLFAVLSIIGIGESAVVAFIIFSFHVATLTTLSICAFIYAVKHPHIFTDNWKTELPEIDFAGTKVESNVAMAIFFGFAAAMLGITGFESSANFVEEQKPGVFRKTLRNMWLFVTVYNAVLSFLSIAVLPMEDIYANQGALLAVVGRVSTGKWLEVLVAIDAFVVLSGAVLTSYVGIVGLVRRLASDRVVPAFFMRQNSWRKTNHYIIIMYFLIASSLVLALKADNTILGGVYTYAFLGLMTLFVSGCMILKVKRAEIPRDVSAPWWSCIFGVIMLIIGIFGNLLGDPKVLMYFALYFIGVASMIFLMFERLTILQVALAIMRKLFPSKAKGPDQESLEGQEADASAVQARTGARGGRTITRAIVNIKTVPIIFFCKHPDMTIINKAIQYVRKNEQTHVLRVIHVCQPSDKEQGTNKDIAEFQAIIALFDHIYPKLKIDFISVEGTFEAATVEWIAMTLGVSINLMFIAQPGDHKMHSVARLVPHLLECHRRDGAAGDKWGTMTKRSFKSLQYFLNRSSVLAQYRQFLRLTAPLDADVRRDVRQQIRASYVLYRDVDDEKHVRHLLRQGKDQLQHVSDLVDSAVAQQRIKRAAGQGESSLWTDAQAMESPDHGSLDDVKGRVGMGIGPERHGAMTEPPTEPPTLPRRRRCDARTTKLTSDFASELAQSLQGTITSMANSSVNEFGAPSQLTYHAMGSPSIAPLPGQQKLHRRKIQVEVTEDALTNVGPMWMYPGGGSAQHVRVPAEELQEVQDELNKPKHLLSEWPATAISGNDILSSVLYSSAGVVAKSGKLMPIPLFLVAIVLYFFRFIYEEVVTAIPLNGGSYNVLLNTTSKRTAAFAACLGILSYVATGVVSATSGVNYLSLVVDIPIVGTVVILLLAFAILAWLGITESSRVAFVIFVHHVVVLTVLVVTCAIYTFKHPHVFRDNMHSDYPEVDFCGSKIEGTVFTAIFFGFGASMLGITGFESSAQYVEEQAPGVFRKTLRNMWAFVSVYNLLMGVLILGVLPMDTILANTDYLLGEAAFEAGGEWLKVWVCIDAFIVLAGAVLTSYVGIQGLVRRLSGDRVLPNFLTTRNKLRGTTHYIIILYFLLASSLVIFMNGEITVLGGVYTYAFLGMMALFSSGCMLLKSKRAEIPRDINCPWHVVIGGFLMVIIAMFANLLGDPKVLMTFSFYFIGVALVMFFMLERVTILRSVLVVMKRIAPSKHKGMMGEFTGEVQHTGARGGRTITKAIMDINEKPIVFFAKNPNMTIINKAVSYVRRNELTHNLRVVHVYDDEETAEAVLSQFEEIITLFDHIYPKLRIDFVSVQGQFTPAIVEWLAQSMQIPTNMMFIAQPSNCAAHQVSTCGSASFARSRMDNKDTASSYHVLSSPLGYADTKQLRERRVNLRVKENVAAGPLWLYPPGGNAEHVHVPQQELDEIQQELDKPKVLLDEWPSTAISSNDILSSVLYSAGLVSSKAGKLMPVPMFLVCTTLYLFRFIYEEVVTAIPLNGGSYNALLNTTSKRVASFAAVCGILSYLATAVVSATTGVKYLNHGLKILVESDSDQIPIVWCTVALLFVFAILAWVGIQDSSRVALTIFLAHCVLLTVLVITAFVKAMYHPHIFWDNMRVDYPDVDFLGSMLSGNAATAIFFGFGACMLGVTGFETSAQFVEEQKPGVFRKTLRNMWAMVSVYNLSIAFLTLAVLPLETEGKFKGMYTDPDTVVVRVGEAAGGKWLAVWVAIDAFIVLAGALVTSNVGIIGLVHRLSNDRVLPAFLASENKMRGTTHWIIILFFLLCSSLVIILDADSTVLGGVFTYAFLGLMLLFSCGCMLLKSKRDQIPRDVKAPWWVVIVGFMLIFAGMLANLLGDPRVLTYFAYYFLIVAIVVFVMLERVTMLRVLLRVMRSMFPSKYKHMEEEQQQRMTECVDMQHTGARGGRTIVQAILNINKPPIVFFCKAPDLTLMNKAIMYVRRNEQTHNLRFVHVYGDVECDAQALEEFAEMVALFDFMYPKIRIDFVSIQGEFNPAMVAWVSKSMDIPRNMMFIRQPSNFAAHRVSTCGVRVITA
ncbi:TPA: hypothetical protein N0F65_007052 [Lagenidium giganteum]|uniref:Complex 1 LYR protein domain-containing protein n=1 Tax=Lagenidium giganteum TaxID=4803 RepID=A0AAV2YXN7_9STRA|nr:TPA: hypothetical protein N0F65_007052 [Lagenidium giganteum]